MSNPRSTPRGAATTSRGKGASEIAPHVFIGGWKDAADFVGTRFCVLDELPEGMPTATHVPIYDEKTGTPQVRNLDRVAAAIDAAREKGESVLVFCGHGVRRSPLAGAWYLHRTEKLSLDAAYDRILKVRPKVERAAAWVGHPESLDP
jgi:protein-tyrosine phosphatase